MTMKRIYTLCSLLYLSGSTVFAMNAEPPTPETTLTLQAPATGHDAGEALRELIRQAAESTQPTTISIPKGVYHFYPDNAPEQKLYISNHDQQDSHRIGIPLQGLRKVSIKGNGSTFVFHGKMLPLLLMDCAGICISDINIAVDSPLAREGRIVKIDEQGGVTMQFPKTPAWNVENGKFTLSGRGWKLSPNHALGFRPDGAMLAHGLWGDMVWNFPAEQVSEDCVRFNTGSKWQQYKLLKGDTLVLRNAWRPHPGMLLYRAEDTTLNNVVFHDSLGMALIAQRSRNIHINGGGCLRAPGRVHTTAADATHFSNCAGLILVENATYEGMMDDAINVHATCPAIEKIISPTEFLARFMHSQAYGFEIAAPGEKLQFIRGKTLENTEETCEVKEVQVISPKHILVKLKQPMPEGIGEGDAVENADWHPQVIFRNNTVRHNRARGALFTTPHPVLVEGNHFDHSSGSAILLAGDAQGWYESGRCLDVCIRNNTFEHNLTALYQFTHAIISICPEVRELTKQQTRYHHNVRIEDNTFITHRVPLLYAVSASDVSFRNNKITYTDLYPAAKNTSPFILQYCDNMQLEEPAAKP